MALLMAAVVGACGREVVQEPITEVTTVETTVTTTATTEWTTATLPTLLPVVEDLDWAALTAEPAEDYDEVLERYRRVLNGGTIDYGYLGGSVSFMRYDLDDDFVPELFVALCPGSFSYKWYVYSMQAGKPYLLGEFLGQAAEDFYSNPEGGIYCQQVHGGIGAVFKITKRGNQLVVGGSVPLNWTDEEGNNTWELLQNSVELTMSGFSEGDHY